MTNWRTKISPKSGRGLGHVTPTIFGSTVGYPSDSLASCSLGFSVLLVRFSLCSSILEQLFKFFKVLFLAVVRPPGTLVPKAFCFSRDVFYFLTRHRISELRRLIAAKLCTVISICVNFLMQVQKLVGSSLKNFTPAKFSVDFTQLLTLIANISGTRQDIKNRKDM